MFHGVAARGEGRRTRVQREGRRGRESRRDLSKARGAASVTVHRGRATATTIARIVGRLGRPPPGLTGPPPPGSIPKKKARASRGCDPCQRRSSACVLVLVRDFSQRYSSGGGRARDATRGSRAIKFRSH